MSVSIIPCPSCSSLLLSDTAQCPTCKHILDAERATELPEIRLHSDSQNAILEIECPDCCEKVRQELVRCWRCGAFLKPEIFESYQKMLAQRSSIVYTTPPQDQGDEAPLEPSQSDTPKPSSSGTETTFRIPTEATSANVSDDEDGFTLAPGIEVRRPTESAGQPETSTQQTSTVDTVPEGVSQEPKPENDSDEDAS